MYGTDANSAGLCPYPYLPGVARRFRCDGVLSESIAGVSNNIGSKQFKLLLTCRFLSTWKMSTTQPTRSPTSLKERFFPGHDLDNSNGAGFGRLMCDRNYIAPTIMPTRQHSFLLTWGNLLQLVRHHTCSRCALPTLAFPRPRTLSAAVRLMCMAIACA